MHVDKNIKTSLETEINLLNKIMQNYNNIGHYELISFLSFLSLVFKRVVGNDDLIQQFEVAFLRENAFKIDTVEKLYKLLLEDERLTFVLVVKILDQMINNKQQDINFETIQQLIANIAMIIKNHNQDNQLQYVQQSLLIEDNNIQKFTLTPTQGVSMLNNNPYSFFVNKILNLQPINDWESQISSKYYGLMMHAIMQQYAENVIKQRKIIEMDDNTMKQQLIKIFDDTKNHFLQETKIKINYFIGKKIEIIKKIAVYLELEAIKNHRTVSVERQYCKNIGKKNLLLYAKADRVEIDNIKKTIYIYDFKTGEVPKEIQEVNGEKTQLLIIAMLILNTKTKNGRSFKEEGYIIERMRYIDLSGKDVANNNDIQNKQINIVEQRIDVLINTFFDEKGLPCLKNMFYIKPCGNIFYSNDILLMKMIRKKFI